MAQTIQAIIGTKAPHKPEPPPAIPRNGLTFILAATNLEEDSPAYRAYCLISGANQWQFYFPVEYPGCVYRHRKSDSKEDAKFAGLYSRYYVQANQQTVN